MKTISIECSNNGGVGHFHFHVPKTEHAADNEVHYVSYCTCAYSIYAYHIAYIHLVTRQDFIPYHFMQSLSLQIGAFIITPLMFHLSPGDATQIQVSMSISHYRLVYSSALCS